MNARYLGDRSRGSSLLNAVAPTYRGVFPASLNAVQQEVLLRLSIGIAIRCLR
jgi:hypothetical protein